MCFDAIDEYDRGLYVACAVPKQQQSMGSTTSMRGQSDEEVVGFCIVDGRTPDPSCKIEHLTQSTLASTSPRPYLSDLAVSPSHRRRGLGELLVKACEEWTRHRGYDKLYLKVDEKNASGMGLYCSMGYAKTVVPWSKTSSSKYFEPSVLMEKSLVATKVSSQQKSEVKREWLRNLWRRRDGTVAGYESTASPPPL